LVEDCVGGVYDVVDEGEGSVLEVFGHEFGGGVCGGRHGVDRGCVGGEEESVDGDATWWVSSEFVWIERSFGDEKCGFSMIKFNFRRIFVHTYNES